MIELRSLATDPAAARRLARAAVRVHGDPEAEIAPFLDRVERELGEGTAAGRLALEGDRPVGLALWVPTGGLGLTVEMLYLEGAAGTKDAYVALVREVEATAGPVAFLPGRLAGLSEAEESDALRSLGFLRFARSEMRFPPGAAAPGPDPTPGLREISPDDEAPLAALLDVAYRGRLDRYLFQVDPDPRRDAELQVREILEGRWGELVPWASFVVPDDGRVAASTIVVRAPYGALIAQVMVDPLRQGRGLGRAVLSATVRALRARGESIIVLNVTEENGRAVRLYERLGFVRTLGPWPGWYSATRVPVDPPRD